MRLLGFLIVPLLVVVMGCQKSAPQTGAPPPPPMETIRTTLQQIVDGKAKGSDAGKIILEAQHLAKTNPEQGKAIEEEGKKLVQMSGAAQRAKAKEMLEKLPPR